jgi:hypothetical protein
MGMQSGPSLVSVPLLVLLLLGQRAETILPKARAWMTANSWIRSEITPYCLGS